MGLGVTERVVDFSGIGPIFKFLSYGVKDEGLNEGIPSASGT